MAQVNTQPDVTRTVSNIAYAVAAFLSVGVALVSYRYILHVGPVAEIVAGNMRLNPWLTLHAAGAATALLLGPMQFLSYIRNRYRKLHRWWDGSMSFPASLAA